MFKPEDVMNAPETSEEKPKDAQEKQSPENKADKIRIIETIKDPNFEGSTIIKTENAEGRVVGYALRKGEDGELEGNKINYQPDGSMGAVYQIHKSDFAELKQQGIIDSYESSLIAEKSKEFDEAKMGILRIYIQGEHIDPWMGRFPEDSLFNPVKEALKGLNSEDQEKLASEFFNNTIGKDIRNNKNAYKVYALFKGTPFAQKFKQLESDRLQKAGFSEFTL